MQNALSNANLLSKLRLYSQPLEMMWHEQPANLDWTFVAKWLITKVREHRIVPYALLTYKLINSPPAWPLKPDVLADSFQENKSNHKVINLKYCFVLILFQDSSLFGKYKPDTCWNLVFLRGVCVKINVIFPFLCPVKNTSVYAEKSDLTLPKPQININQITLCSQTSPTPWKIINYANLSFYHFYNFWWLKKYNFYPKVRSHETL